MEILADHDIGGQAMMLWRMLCEHGWTEMIPLKLLLFNLEKGYKPIQIYSPREVTVYGADQYQDA